LILFIPLLGFVLLGIGGKNRFRQSAGAVATVLMAVSTVLSMYIAWKYFFSQPTPGQYSTITAFKNSLAAIF
jgi:NADH:ubiquinone oxidoreductase subunit 5 (subunit L)/multisubunit Na+/H+ antiporter MnhA subunit